MYTIKQTPIARFLALTTILGLIFAFLLTPTLAETPDTYQTSRFASHKRVDDSVRKYAQTVEAAGFRFKRKQIRDEGRGWARLGRRQDAESSKGVDELSDNVSTILYSSYFSFRRDKSGIDLTCSSLLSTWRTGISSDCNGHGEQNHLYQHFGCRHSRNRKLSRR